MTEIFIVEDDEISMELISIGVRKLEKEIIIVQTGIDALDVCE